MRKTTRVAIVGVEVQGHDYTYEYQLEDEHFKAEYQIEQFVAERFLLQQNTYHAATFSGSTFANSRSNGPLKALDASVSDYIVDDLGVRVGFAMATADGLGHSSEEKENESTAAVSLAACEAFVNSAQKIPESIVRSDMAPSGFLNTALQSKRSRLAIGRSADQFFESKSSLTTACILRDHSSQFKAILGNIGDGLVMVVDHQTGTIKQILAPRQYKMIAPGGQINWNPASLQDLSLQTINQVQVAEIKDLAEDDIVIQMSDGIWSEFPFTWGPEQGDSKESKISYREAQLEREPLEEILGHALGLSATRADSKETRGIDSKGTGLEESTNRMVRVPANQIAQRLVDAAASTTLSARAKFRELLSALQPHITALQQKKFADAKEDHAYTIASWLEDISKSNQELAEQLQTFLASSQQDAFQYDLAHYPASRLMDDLSKKAFGDCATIAVMRVPNRKVELIREFKNKLGTAEGLQELPALASEIFQEFKTMADTQLAVHRLRIEGEIEPAKATPFINLIDHALAINNQLNTNKLQSQTQFKTLLTRQDIDPEDKMILFAIFKSRRELNTHRNPCSDALFGLNKTASWGATIKTIRDSVKAQIFAKIAAGEVENPIAYLKWAKKQDLFCEHRSNYLITGAWGRTQAVKDIDNKIEELERAATRVQTGLL